MFILDNSNKYVVTTDSKYMTLRSDGGSNINTYYQIDLNNRKVIYCSDEYVGFKGYKYQSKIIYIKLLTETEANELQSILNNISTNNEDKNDSFLTDSYFYTISFYNQDNKMIYDKDIINKIENILKK